MFINLSNHPSSLWEKEQRIAAEMYGNIFDIPFPTIDPEWETEDVCKLVNIYAEKVYNLLPNPDKYSAIHLMGESVFVFQLATLLISKGYQVVASTTLRIVQQDKNEKKSIFKFVKFRNYE